MCGKESGEMEEEEEEEVQGQEGSLSLPLSCV